MIKEIEELKEEEAQLLRNIKNNRDEVEDLKRLVKHENICKSKLSKAKLKRSNKEIMIAWFGHHIFYSEIRYNMFNVQLEFSPYMSTIRLLSDWQCIF